ncbi:hypothetical protein EDI_193940 [Entamoeba dispar SAW760]|uniref:TLDc domain-containing protein n=1 Tax=Entamoeba dispar (strain ATCC PRA-260 / SAW760) TaxID=370354 RepID=B0EAC8_ENTDS|nr:uncharacterized protein EDI_193940 [Entamoeba dispar SAW760]EDR28513.1 hypothetical protein EDI_193940 [Entamoeba dispar SAW760]|eukprot:EDR28513.1 hypothetical protein EDI_193940 [Entamoeba dispar SAW760]
MSTTYQFNKLIADINLIIDPSIRKILLEIVRIINQLVNVSTNQITEQINFNYSNNDLEKGILKMEEWNNCKATVIYDTEISQCNIKEVLRKENKWGIICVDEKERIFGCSKYLSNQCLWVNNSIGTYERLQPINNEEYMISICNNEQMILSIGTGRCKLVIGKEGTKNSYSYFLNFLFPNSFFTDMQKFIVKRIVVIKLN